MPIHRDVVELIAMVVVIVLSGKFIPQIINKKHFPDQLKYFYLLAKMPVLAPKSRKQYNGGAKKVCYNLVNQSKLELSQL